MADLRTLLLAMAVAKSGDSVTETDPIYSADKPSIAFKTDLIPELKFNTYPTVGDSKTLYIDTINLRTQIWNSGKSQYEFLDNDVQAYNTTTDFPTTPERGVIYIDVSKKMLYIWDGIQYSAIITLSNVVEATLATFPNPGSTTSIYIDIETNITYRWGGTQYVEISSSLVLGDTSSTAHRGDLGKIAYDHSQTVGNSHNLVKADIGLGNVDNTSDNVKQVAKADKWTNSRYINFTGGFSGSASFDGSSDINVNTALNTQAQAYKIIDSTKSPYTVLVTDSVICVDDTLGSVVIMLPKISTLVSQNTTKNYSIIRNGTGVTNDVVVASNANPQELFNSIPTGLFQYKINPNCTLNISTVVGKNNVNIWNINNTDTLLNYGGLSLNQTITSNIVLTRQGGIYLVNATNSNISITLPPSIAGVGSIKFIRTDTNRQFTVSLVAPENHTISYAYYAYLYSGAIITTRTLSVTNKNLIYENSTPNMNLNSYFNCQLRGAPVGYPSAGGGSLAFATNIVGYESYDPYGMHSGFSNPSRVYIPQSGFYEVSGGCSVNITGAKVTTSIYKNGVPYESVPNYGNASGVMGFVRTLIRCAIGDYLELFVVGTANGMTFSNAWFSVKFQG